MAIRGSRRLAIENQICIGLAIISASNGDSFFSIQTTEFIHEFTTATPHGAVLTVNAAVIPITDIETAGAIGIIIHFTDPIVQGDLITLKIPPNWPVIRGLAGGYICQGVYVAVVP